MSSIGTAIELQDNFTSILYQVITSVDLGVAAMDELNQSMSCSMDTSSMEAAQNSIYQVEAAVQELNAAVQQMEAPTIHAPVTPLPTLEEWQSYQEWDGFENIELGGFEREVAKRECYVGTFE